MFVFFMTLSWVQSSHCWCGSICNYRQGQADLVQSMADSLGISTTDVSAVLSDTNDGLSIQYSIIGNHNTQLQTTEFQTTLVNNMQEYTSLEPIVSTFSTPSSNRNSP